jgi:hypothetical protein
METILMIMIITGLSGLAFGLVIGFYVGQAMLETVVANYIEREPFAPVFELGDMLFPKKMKQIIAVPEPRRWEAQSNILRRNWGKISHLNCVLIMAVLCACSGARLIPEPHGTVIAVDGNIVKVGYPIIQKEEVIGMSVTLFNYRHGHGYIVNDFYPDCEKENY